MLIALKKRALKSLLPFTVVLFVIGLLFLGFSLKNFAESRQEIVDMDTLDFSGGVNEVKDTYVSATLYGIYDCYEEETTGIVTTARWYLIDADDTYYIAVKISGNSLSNANKLMDYSQKYLDEQIEWEELQNYSMNVTGFLRKLKGEDLSYFNEYLEDLDDEVKELFLPVCLEVGDNSNVSSAFVGLLCIAIIFLILGLIMLSLLLTSTKQVKRFMAGMGGEEIADMRLQSFYTGTPDYQGCHVNGDYILLKKGYKYFLGESSKVVWAYMHQQNTKYMGIFTIAKSFGVMVHMEDGKAFMSQMKNEAMAKEFLEQIAGFCPKAVVGYSDELKKLYRKDRTSFLSLKYNKEETAEER